MTTINQMTQHVALALLVSLATACDENDKTGGGKQNTSEEAASATSQNSAGSQGNGHKPEEQATDAPGNQQTAPANSVDVTMQRMAKVATDSCANDFMCYPDEAADDWGDDETCVEELLSDFRSVLVDYGTECADAQIDLYECEVEAACDEDQEARCEFEFLATADCS